MFKKNTKKKQNFLLNGEIIITNLNDFVGKELIHKSGKRLIVKDVLEDEAFISIVDVVELKRFFLHPSYFTNLLYYDDIQSFSSKSIQNTKVLNEIKTNKFLAHQSVFSKINDIIIGRNITELVHFTSMDNLLSILNRGLVTRNVLETLGSFHCSDENRIDGNGDICISISFPNYKMFYAKRDLYKERTWVVILLDPQLLTSLRANYYYTNAASLSIQSSLRQYNTLDDFENLFCEQYPPFSNTLNPISRNMLNLPDNYTTNPQAEIQILENVNPKYINSICFQNTDDISTFYNKYLNVNISNINNNTISYSNSIINKNITFTVNKKLFNARDDYKFWSRENDETWQ